MRVTTPAIDRLRRALPRIDRKIAAARQALAAAERRLGITSTHQVLRALAQTPADAFTIGAIVWPGRTGRISSAGGGGDYAAQMLLGRLRKRGLVRTQAAPGSSVWELTRAGRDELARLEAL